MKVDLLWNVDAEDATNALQEAFLKRIAKRIIAIDVGSAFPETTTDNRYIMVIMDGQTTKLKLLLLCWLIKGLVNMEYHYSCILTMQKF